MDFIGWLALFVRKFFLLAAFLIKSVIGHLGNCSATRDFKNSADIYEDHKQIKNILGEYYRGETSLLV